MKNFITGFLIGFGVWCLLAFVPQFVRCWINGIRFRIARKRAKDCDKWMFEDMEGKK